MVQILIELTETEREQLAALARQTGKSESMVVREALHQHLGPAPSEETNDESLRAAFGLWKNLGIDSLEYQRRIRSEWDRGYRSGTE
jgi:hypothetical protein